MKYSRYLVFFMAMALIAFALFTLTIQPALASGSTPSSITLDPSPTTSPTSVSSTPTPTATPNIQPVSTTNTIKVVHEQNLLGINVDGWLASLILPGEVAQHATVLLSNQGSTLITLVNPTLSLVGQQTGVVPVSSQISLPSSIVLPPGKVFHLTLTIQANTLVPDHYVGSVQFSEAKSTTVVTIPLDISVRNGPFWPIIMLILGILFGRLSLDMATPLARKQCDLLPRYDSLNKELSNAQFSPNITMPIGGATVGIKDRLNAYLSTIYSHIESADPSITENQVSQEIDNLEICFDFYENNLPLLLAQQSDSDEQNLLEDAKDALLKENVNDAAQKIGSILTQYTPQPKPDSVQMLNAGFHGSQRLMQKMLYHLATSGAEAKGRQKRLSRLWAWVALCWTAIAQAVGWILEKLAGLSNREAELRYRIVRPILACLLLILLILIGLDTLYVSAGTSFGSAGLYDYLGLFLWGFSADIAQRSLQNLPALPTKS